jgi:cobaltochelatase CobS
MYFTSKLTAEQLKIVQSDDDIHRSYDLIIMLSNDFKSDSSIAKQLDEQVETFVKSKEKSKPKPKPQAKPKSEPKPKAEPKPKDEPKAPKNDKIQQTLTQLMEQLQEAQSGKIDAAQIEAIVKNILKNRTICFEDLCPDLLKLVKETTNIKVIIPNFETKSFKNDIPNLLKIIDDIAYGNNVMLIGGAGTGKTFLAEKVANVLGLETETINCNQFTSPIEINGGQTIEGYQEGKLIKAWSEGKLLILDELPKLDPNTAGILNEALAKTAIPSNSDRAYIVNTRGDRFKKKDGFAVIATGNVYPNTESNAYGANNKQDLSLLDRFGGSVYEIEKNPEFEKKVILPGHLFIWAFLDIIRSLIEKNKWEAQVSIRIMETSLRVYLAEMEALKKGITLDDRKTLKDVVDSFLWTFTEVQQVELKRAIEYNTYFANFQYRKIDINKNPY